jgi:aromatic ring-cleaving dioxygenase
VLHSESGGASQISAYHAHVYYDPMATREAAERIRSGVADRFSSARLGRWHGGPVGPHTRAIFQIAFGQNCSLRWCLGSC